MQRRQRVMDARLHHRLTKQAHQVIGQHRHAQRGLGPMKLRIPTKLGYKNPKHIVAMFVTNTNPGGYWEDKGYNWFGGS